jgi:hypothetical protein
MSKAAKRRHIKSNGCDVYDSCPYCKGDTEEGMELDYGDVDAVESGDLEQTVTCLLCGRKWIDVFRLVDVREVY